MFTEQFGCEQVDPRWLEHGVFKCPPNGARKTWLYVSTGLSNPWESEEPQTFSGFGSEKRVTLFDTLINDLDEEEIVSVLAHEVGHYKRKHIIFNLFASILLTGLTLYILSVFISNPLLSNAIGVEIPSFHAGLIAFGLLYSPISEITGLIMNYFSRKFEYQADDYAKNTYKAEPLITSLKKLSKNSLSNLTPHKAYVFMHYSHPTLLQRIQNLKS